MGQHKDVWAAGDRVETLLADLRNAADPKVARAAEELVQTLVDLYGEALAHMMHVASESPAVAEALAADPLVESLLLVHDLHPVDVDTRIQRALDDVRPYLGSHAGGVEYRGVGDDGVVRLKLEGSCHGCPSSTVTVRLAIERAIADAAPDTAGVEVEGVVDEPAGPPLLQIGHRAPATVPAPAAPLDPEGWAHLPEWPTDAADTRTVNLSGESVLICNVGGALYAYRDGCPECAGSLSGALIDGDALRCPSCGRGYDVRLAGVGTDDPRRHLNPLPLLHDDAGVRVAVGTPTAALATSHAASGLGVGGQSLLGQDVGRQGVGGQGVGGLGVGGPP